MQRLRNWNVLWVLCLFFCIASETKNDRTDDYGRTEGLQGEPLFKRSNSKPNGVTNPLPVFCRDYVTKRFLFRIQCYYQTKT